MRIISGRFGGRDLGAVPEGVRPTSDRVRESLFSVLGSVEGLSVLDLFAGTGALGLETVSRGASEVLFVERSRRVARELSQRLERLGLDASFSTRPMKKAIARARWRLFSRPEFSASMQEWSSRVRNGILFRHCPGCAFSMSVTMVTPS